MSSCIEGCIEGISSPAPRPSLPAPPAGPAGPAESLGTALGWPVSLTPLHPLPSKSIITTHVPLITDSFKWVIQNLDVMVYSLFDEGTLYRSPEVTCAG